jgi:hypothetical protein
MITLNPAQAAAVPFVREELAKGGEMVFNAPVGVGKSIVLIEAIRDVPRVAYLSCMAQLREQFKHLCGEMNVHNVTFIEPRTGLVGHFELVVADESARDIKINHPCVIRY